MAIILLLKIDVAKRELDHAIKLFLNGGDIVAIHLVISACQEILGAIGRSDKSIRSELLKRVKKEKQKEVVNKLNEAYNFFKHADTDSDKLLKFNPDASEFAIFDSIAMYQAITSEATGLMQAFRVWFYLKHSDILLYEEQKTLFN
ncbi:MAG: hypothetical protein ABH816_02720 [Candidatus Levyibacteriota bacterium]